MPLTKLFHKRGSQKNKKEVPTKHENTKDEKLSPIKGATVEDVQLLSAKNVNAEDVPVLAAKSETADVKLSSVKSVNAEDVHAPSTKSVNAESEMLTNIAQNNTSAGDKTQTENILYKPVENVENPNETDTVEQLAEGGTVEVTKNLSTKESFATITSNCNYGEKQEKECISVVSSSDNFCLTEESCNRRARRYKYRSGSHTDENLKTKERFVSRRKFGSESEVLKISGHGDEKIIQMRERDLEEVIGRCVNKIIRESIVTAVNSVNANDLYEEIVKNFSDRRNSGNSESCELYTVEQTLPSEALYEYVEEEYISNTDRDNISQEKVDCCVTISEEDDYKDQESTDYEAEDIRDIALEGYQADCEENSIIYSSTSESSSKKVATQETELRNVTSNENQEKTSKANNGNYDNILHDLNVPDKITTQTGNVSYSDVSTTDETISQEDKAESPDLTKTRGSTMTESSEFVRTRGSTMTDSSELILMSLEEELSSQSVNNSKDIGTSNIAQDLGENLTEQQCSEEEKKVNWKVGYLHVKLPHKSRGKGHLKVWKKRCVAIQPDEFVNDPKNPCLMISVYNADSGTSRKHGAIFWKAVSCQKAVVYRSNSRTHPYAFTISNDNKAVIHLAAESETASQEWMAAIRAILWPPSPVIQLEKMLYGNEFEISMIDNEFAFHAGLLGTYGYLTITPKKLILIHPQQGYVIQEWYLNTVDKFQLMPQSRIEDVHKVLAMTTCSDSSTGKGEILMFCKESLALLQSLATTIHQVLSFHSKQEGGKYQKELEEIANWLMPGSTQTTRDETTDEEYYKVPPRQVKSLLDIPNFIFEKPLTPVASTTCAPGTSMDILKPTLDASKTNNTTASRDSGISSENAADDFLNCSITSFVVGGGAFPGKSSDSELSDAYTPPRSPELKKKIEHDEEFTKPSLQTTQKNDLFNNS